MTANEILSRGGELTQKAMERFLSAEGRVADAMRYSAFAGGKRLRPALLLEFYRLCGGRDHQSAACFAAALEFIHTYSLIHDDLPCMDDDDLRRGRPSCHIKFGEDIALLAGDGLLTLAFFAASSSNAPPDRAIKAVNILSRLAGISGMVGGQEIDLAIEGKTPKIAEITRMYSLKTGALLRASAMIGTVLAGGEKYLAAAEEYSENLGLAFQITDDILDLTGSAEEIGKPIGSDQKNNKSTLVSLLGLEEAARAAEKYSAAAEAALSSFGSDANGLRELTRKLCERRK